MDSVGARCVCARSRIATPTRVLVPCGSRFEPVWEGGGTPLPMWCLQSLHIGTVWALVHGHKYLVTSLLLRSRPLLALQVSETSHKPPSEDLSAGINCSAALSVEATAACQAFSQQVPAPSPGEP